MLRLFVLLLLPAWAQAGGFRLSYPAGTAAFRGIVSLHLGEVTSGQSGELNIEKFLLENQPTLQVMAEDGYAPGMEVTDKAAALALFRREFAKADASALEIVRAKADVILHRLERVVRQAAAGESLNWETYQELLTVGSAMETERRRYLDEDQLDRFDRGLMRLAGFGVYAPQRLRTGRLSETIALGLETIGLSAVGDEGAIRRELYRKAEGFLKIPPTLIRQEPISAGNAVRGLQPPPAFDEEKFWDARFGELAKLHAATGRPQNRTPETAARLAGAGFVSGEELPDLGKLHELTETVPAQHDVGSMLVFGAALSGEKIYDAGPVDLNKKIRHEEPLDLKKRYDRMLVLLYPGRHAVAARLAAASAIADMDPDAVFALYAQMRAIVKDALEEAAMLAFGAAIGKADLADMRNYFEWSKTVEPGYTMVGATLAAAAAIAHRPYATIENAYRRAKLISPNRKNDAAELAMAAVWRWR